GQQDRARLPVLPEGQGHGRAAQLPPVAAPARDREVHPQRLAVEPQRAVQVRDLQLHEVDRLHRHRHRRLPPPRRGPGLRRGSIRRPSAWAVPTSALSGSPRSPAPRGRATRLSSRVVAVSPASTTPPAGPTERSPTSCTCPSARRKPDGPLTSY